MSRKTKRRWSIVAGPETPHPFVLQVISARGFDKAQRKAARWLMHRYGNLIGAGLLNIRLEPSQ